MTAEKAYMGKSRAKVWTYTFLAVLILVGAVVANAAFSNPDIAKNGVKSFLGMPGWALATVTFALGAGIYWIGLKVETDWPEFVGAFLMLLMAVLAVRCFAFLMFLSGLCRRLRRPLWTRGGAAAPEIGSCPNSQKAEQDKNGVHVTGAGSGRGTHLLGTPVRVTLLSRLAGTVPVTRSNSARACA